MGKQEIEIEVKISRFAKLFGTPITKIQKGLSSIGRGLNKVGTAAKKAGKVMAVVGAGITAIGALALKAAGDFEQQKVAFETMLGSAEKADRLLRQIEEFSASTPFQLPGLIEGSKRLLAFGVSANEVVGSMRRLGDLAQGDQQALSRLTDAFGKLRAKGKASLEEINRFTEAGVPLVDELAKNYGITTAEVLNLVSKGKVGFAEVEAAVKSLTSEGGKFFNLTAKQSLTLNGLVSTLKDNFGLLIRDIGTRLLPILKPFIANMITVLQKARSVLPKFLVSVEKFFIDIKATAKISMETIKEVIARPFSFETYRDIIANTLNRMKMFFGLVKDIAKGGFAKLKEFLKQIQEEERLDNKTLTEEIIAIKKDANDQKLALDKKLLDEIKKLKEDELAFNEDTNAKIIDNDKLTADEQLKIKKKQAADFKTFSDFIINGVRSQSKEVSAISKAMAIYNIGIKSYEAAMSAYSAMAGIPFIGPVLGIGAAAAALAFGAEQANAVNAQEPGFEKGGIIPGSSFTGDKVKVRANSREGVFTLDQQKQLFDMANGNAQANQAKDLTVVLRVSEKDIAGAVVHGYNTGRNLDLITQLTTE